GALTPRTAIARLHHGNDARALDRARGHESRDLRNRWRRRPLAFRRRLNRRILRIEWQTRAARSADLVELALESRVPRIPAHRLHEELQTVALLVLVVAVTLEHPKYRFGHHQDVGRGKEFVERRTRSAH